MKIQEKKEELEYPMPKGEQISDNYELLKYAVDVKSRIRKDITADFTLAKLDEQDKVGVRDMTTNAYYVKNVMLRSILKLKKWVWNKEEKKWTNVDDKESAKYIAEKANETFDFYMKAIYMTVILNRNKEKNPMLNIIGNAPMEDDSEEENTKKLATVVGDAIKENKNAKQTKI